MKSDDKNCSCCEGEYQGVCPEGDGAEVFPYWCQVCRQAVSEKRCPLCGLKARKQRGREVS
jgi:hypothetical protein